MMSISPILCLFFFGSPAAIVGCVITIIIDSIQRVFGTGTFPHVVIEGDKRVSPALAYCNSSTTIQMKLWSVGAVTATNHVFPACELGAMRHAVILASFLFSHDKASFRRHCVSSCNLGQQKSKRSRPMEVIEEEIFEKD